MSSTWAGLSNFADTVVTDLGAFGVIGQPNVGGHQTTQVTRTNPQTGVMTSLSSSGASAATTASTTNTLLLVGAGIALVIGLFYLMKNKKV
ncbi:MAG: hypothetical protein ACYDAL_16260 [Candidatus Dormibacteraceae bacterium]